MVTANNKCSEDEWHNRINLAACYHLADYFQMSDIIWNHITAKTSKDKDTFLINPFGLRYDEITASNLVEVTLEGKVINSDSPINDTGFIIHGAIHQARPDVNCVMHTHSRAGLAVSCFENGLTPMIQNKMKEATIQAMEDARMGKAKKNNRAPIDPKVAKDSICII